MAAEDSLEDLPHGWSPGFDAFKVKFYVNSITGQRFNTKDDLMQYVKAQNPQLDEPLPIESLVERPSDNDQIHLTQNTEDFPGWLPHGWTMELNPGKRGRVYKCYFDPSTGRKFYSKPQVLRFMQIEKQKSSTSKQKKKLASTDPACKPEWLPDGWNVEQKTRKAGSSSGLKYKCYVDPSTGLKFFSKPQVFRYLNSVEQKSSTSKNLNSVAQKSSTSKRGRKSTMDDLPPGWIKEIRTRKTANGIKSDPFYIDPVSGYVFRSKRDAQRYLETGDIHSCAILPKKQDIEGNILPSSATTKRKKLRHPVTRLHLIGGGTSSGAGSMGSQGAVADEVQRPTRNDIPTFGRRKRMQEGESEAEVRRVLPQHWTDFCPNASILHPTIQSEIRAGFLLPGDESVFDQQDATVLAESMIQDFSMGLAKSLSISNRLHKVAAVNRTLASKVLTLETELAVERPKVSQLQRDLESAKKRAAEMEQLARDSIEKLQAMEAMATANHEVEAVATSNH